MQSLDTDKTDEPNFSRGTSFLERLQVLLQIKMHSAAKTMKCGDQTVLKQHQYAITLLRVCPTTKAFLLKLQFFARAIVSIPLLSAVETIRLHSRIHLQGRGSVLPAWDIEVFITTGMWTTVACENSRQSCHGFDKQPCVEGWKTPCGPHCMLNCSPLLGAALFELSQRGYSYSQGTNEKRNKEREEQDWWKTSTAFHFRWSVMTSSLLLYINSGI